MGGSAVKNIEKSDHFLASRRARMMVAQARKLVKKALK